MVTRDEKKALRYLARVRNTTESELLREMRPNEVVAEYHRVREIAVEVA